VYGAQPGVPNPRMLNSHGGQNADFRRR